MKNDETNGNYYPLRLSDSSIVYVQPINCNNHMEEDVGWIDKIFSFDNINNVITSICSTVLNSIEKAKPTKATIELELSIGIESGEISAFLIKGNGEGHLKITMEWDATANTNNEQK